MERLAQAVKRQTHICEVVEALADTTATLIGVINSTPQYIQVNVKKQIMNDSSPLLIHPYNIWLF
jgi:hypothetical protein